MKKVELVEAVATATGLTKADSTRAIDATFAAITEALVKGDKVPLVGFGTFAVSERAAREGRNPRTGETVKIEARKAVTFKAGTALKDAVKMLTSNGKSVTAQRSVPEKIRYKQLLKLQERGMEIIENNA